MFSGIRLRRAARRLKRRLSGRKPVPARSSQATEAESVASATFAEASKEPLTPERALGTHLARGASPTEAAALAIDDLLREQLPVEAQEFADKLSAIAPQWPGAAIAAGVLAHRRGLDAKSRAHLERAGEDVVLQAAPDVWLDLAYRSDPTSAPALAAALVADPQFRNQLGLLEVVRLSYAHRDESLIRIARARLREVSEQDGPSSQRVKADLAWLDRWADASRELTLPTPQDGAVPFALMDYTHVSRSGSTRNVGDYVQTLAALGHLTRHANVRFSSDDAALAELVTRIQRETDPSLKLDTIAANVQLYSVARDASGWQAFPEGTWMLAFGWFMWDYWNLGGYELPMHPNLRPIFVSFHCNRRAMLTDEAVEYLRKYGPVGCRDWSTVDLLLSRGVPAFFSGCLTTTVNTIFRGLRPPPEPVTGYVDPGDLVIPEGSRNLRQSTGALRNRTFAENLEKTYKRLARYRTDYTKIVTKRLHCLLPATSLGLEIEFRPATLADVRFNGLHPLSTAEFATIQSGLRDLLAPIMSAVLGGKSESEVYGLWREITAPSVERAKARHEAPARQPEPRGLSGQASITRAIAGREEAPIPSATTDVVLLPARHEMEHVSHVVKQATARTSGHLRLWIIGDGVSELDLPKGSAEVNLVELRAIGFGVGAGPEERDQLARVSVQDVLPSTIGRVLRLDVASAVLGDLADISSVSLDGHPFAARSVRWTNHSAHAILYRAASRLNANPAAAFELYRLIPEMHGGDFTAFDTATMILDLDALRSRGFGDEARWLVTHYGFSAREALHAVVGPDRAELPPDWEYVPTRDVPLDDARVIYWADSIKPWSAQYAALQEAWLAQ